MRAPACSWTRGTRSDFRAGRISLARAAAGDRRRCAPIAVTGLHRRRAPRGGVSLRAQICRFVREGGCDVSTATLHCGPSARRSTAQLDVYVLPRPKCLFGHDGRGLESGLRFLKPLKQLAGIWGGRIRTASRRAQRTIGTCGRMNRMFRDAAQVETSPPVRDHTCCLLSR